MGLNGIVKGGNMPAKQKICLRCDNGKGYKMIEIWSYKVSGDPDELICYICPNCQYQQSPRKRSK